MDFSKLFPLYHKALLLSGDPHWGTEEQVNAENAFFSEAKVLAEKTGLAEEYQEHCDGLLKANAEEILLFTVNFFLDNNQEHLFGAFQSTRQYKKDSEPYHGDHVMEGYAYLNTYEHFLTECLYIEITNGEWIPPNHSVGGKYGVTIDRSNFTSDNLEELERHVFKFAMAEGYADMIREMADA